MQSPCTSPIPQQPSPGLPPPFLPPAAGCLTCVHGHRTLTADRSTAAGAAGAGAGSGAGAGAGAGSAFLTGALGSFLGAMSADGGRTVRS